MRALEVLKRNIRRICQTGLKILGGVSTFYSIMVSFVSVSLDDFGITQFSCKIRVIGAIIATICVISIFWVCCCKKKRCILNKGNAILNSCYGNLINIGFYKNNKSKKIVVIPVNTCFDTIIDDNIESYDKPLVSSKTLHGLWLKNMLQRGNKLDDIDTKIEGYLSARGIKPQKQLSRKEKCRGKLNCYKIGTIVALEGENDVTFVLLAISNFDENNNARASKDEIIKCLGSLLDFYELQGQGYPMYVPLIGTGRSRVGLTHNDALQTIKSYFLLYNDKIHGTINVVVYEDDRDKVSIFD